MFLTWEASEFLLGNQQTDKNEQLRLNFENEHPGIVHPGHDNGVFRA
jgi:hypothetical protein